MSTWFPRLRLELRARKRLLLVVICSAAFCFQAMAAGTVRYVATSGNDTNNDCTDSANPCRTIANGTNQSNAGDTVEVAAGTYNEHVAISRDLTIAGAGAASTIVDGTNNGRVFDIGNVTVSISDLTI